MASSPSCAAAPVANGVRNSSPATSRPRLLRPLTSSGGLSMRCSASTLPAASSRPSHWSLLRRQSSRGIMIILGVMGLIILGVMGLAALGVPVQSIVIVGGMGGVVTAFAARDILVNLRSGLSLQFSKPFGVGDHIQVGSVEGQVVEIGLITTSLINPEKFLVIVPNSLFSSQAH